MGSDIKALISVISTLCISYIDIILDIQILIHIYIYIHICIYIYIYIYIHRDFNIVSPTIHSKEKP